jgi:hypothetical protein
MTWAPPAAIDKVHSPEQRSNKSVVSTRAILAVLTLLCLLPMP